LLLHADIVKWSSRNSSEFNKGDYCHSLSVVIKLEIIRSIAQQAEIFDEDFKRENIFECRVKFLQIFSNHVIILL
jgi:hypothetical protein